MNTFRNFPSANPAANFDLIRARVENDVPRPAVIVITSTTSEDGKEITARGLALSLAETGCKTLFVSASVGHSGPAKTTQMLDAEIARQLSLLSGAGNVSVLNLSDPGLQQRSGQRSIHSALTLLRDKFDYVVIDAECGAASSFATSLLASADALLVTVGKGRRAKSGDVRLAKILDRYGATFLGVLAVDASLAAVDPASVTFSAIASDVRNSQTSFIDLERTSRREVV